MITESDSGSPEHVLRVMIRAAAIMAPLAVITMSLVGRPAWGGAAAVGLLMGIVNTVVAERLVAVGVPFLATSGVRLVVLTLSAFAALLLFKVAVGIAFVLGVSVAQVTLSGAALAAGARR